MSKRIPPPPAPSPAETSQADRPSRRPRGAWVFGLGTFLVLALAVGLTLALRAPARQEDGTVERFARQRNAGDRGASDLLGRVPVVPDQPVAPEEADRL